MRISDWSSDVCSSDLRNCRGIDREDRSLGDDAGRAPASGERPHRKSYPDRGATSPRDGGQAEVEPSFDSNRLYGNQTPEDENGFTTERWSVDTRTRRRNRKSLV